MKPAGMLPPSTAARLEKAALDNGFDHELPAPEGWLGFASSQAPLRLWLTGLDERLVIGLSQAHVARALADESPVPPDQPAEDPLPALPAGAADALTASDIPSLHRLVRRAFQLSRTLPDELLHVFRRRTAALPTTTEAERLVVQRVGQDVFRAGLLDYWQGRCAITGLAVPELLRASHIKPWAECASDAERLDVFNGLLLAPHLDAAFDRGFITLGDDGRVLVSSALGPDARTVLSLHDELFASGIADGHRAYLPWHRLHVFRQAQPGG